jgi:hypothetical protein
MEPPRVFSTALDDQALHVAYNLPNTRLAAYGRAGRLSTWTREPASRDWTAAASWKVESLTVTCLCWAAPEFGNVLCLGTVEGAVCFWSETPGTGAWSLKATIKVDSRAATAACFAPAHHGPIVAVSFSDGYVRTFKASAVLGADGWDLDGEFQTGPLAGTAATCLTWRDGGGEDTLPPMLCVGTSAGSAEIWTFEERFLRWVRLKSLRGHTNDASENSTTTAVAWAPPVGAPRELLAMATGRQVVLWGLQGAANELECEHVAVLDHEHGVWQLGWNWLGTWLGASTDGGEVCMWRADLSGAWGMRNKVVSAAADVAPSITDEDAMERKY